MKNKGLLITGLSAGVFLAYKLISQRIKKNTEEIIELEVVKPSEKRGFFEIPRESKARKVLKKVAFPVLIGSSTAISYYLPYKYGFKKNKVLGITTISLKVLIYLLEQVIPRRSEWNISDKKELQDILHTILGTLFGASLGKLTNDVVFTWLHKVIFKRNNITVWSEKMPFLLQLVLVFLIADLGRYIQHRAMHQSAYLWKFHVLHHDVDRMTVLKTSRSQVVERFFQVIFLFGALTITDAPKEAVRFYMISNSFLGMFDHSNLDLDLGNLTYVLTGPAEHHIHHSRDLKEENTNFGSALVVWDILFGTYTNPRKYPNSPILLGVDQEVPQTFKEQFFEPFYS